MAGSAMGSPWECDGYATGKTLACRAYAMGILWRYGNPTGMLRVFYAYAAGVLYAGYGNATGVRWV